MEVAAPISGRGALPFAQSLNQSPGSGQLRFVVGGIRRMVCVAARLEGGCDLGQRAFSNSKIAAPLARTVNVIP